MDEARYVTTAHIHLTIKPPRPYPHTRSQGRTHLKPEPGTRTRQVIETEVLPQNSRSEAIATEFYDRDFWEIISDIGRLNRWGDHLVRVYRADDRWERGAALENNKLTDNFNEETIRKNWGGGRYLLWLYGPPTGTKLVARPFRLELEGPTRSGPSAGARGESLGGDPTSQMLLRELLDELRASRGGELGGKAMQNALDIQFRAMEQAIQLMSQRISAPAAAPAQSPFDGIFKELLAALIPALIAKFTNPGSPLDDLSKVAEAAQKFSTILGGGKGGEKPDAMTAIIGNLPALGDRLVSGLREYRLANEAQERAMRLQAGNKVIDVQPATPAGGEATAPAAPVTPAPPVTPAVQPPERPLTEEERLQIAQIEQGIYMKKIFEKIAVTIANDPECNGESLYDFLINTCPEFIPQMKAATREQIVMFFRGDAILSRVADHPRLPQIIDQFLEIANKTE